MAENSGIPAQVIAEAERTTCETCRHWHPLGRGSFGDCCKLDLLVPVRLRPLVETMTESQEFLGSYTFGINFRPEKNGSCRLHEPQSDCAADRKPHPTERAMIETWERHLDEMEVRKAVCKFAGMSDPTTHKDTIELRFQVSDDHKVTGVIIRERGNNRTSGQSVKNGYGGLPGESDATE